MSTPPARKVIHLPKVRLLSRGARQATIGTGLRITNVKSIRPPDPEIVKKQEDDRLRAQLQEEIVSRSRSCAYSRYSCPLPVVSGRAYCARHILSDPAAPYARCVHERCPMPARLAPNDPEHQLCFEHARAALALRQRAADPPPPVTTTEALLNRLQHYVKLERPRTTSCASTVSVVSEPEPEILPHAVNPFKQIDATGLNNAYSTSLMEYASASDSDADSVTIDGTEPGGDLSDPEEAPCEDTPLWRAGVFTAEEAVYMCLSTLRSLQAAYSGQTLRLKQQLSNARLQYLKALKLEREQFCSINSQAMSGPLTVHERRQLRKLKAYASYRRKHGVHAVLARKLHHKRAKVGEGLSRTTIPSGGRCTFSEGGVRCSQHVLPAAKHCLKHISQDTQQVLFATCDDMRGGVPCREPIPRLPLPSPACRYHTAPPHYAAFTLKKDDSDSDSDDGTSVDSQLTHCDTDDMRAASDTQDGPA